MLASYEEEIRHPHTPHTSQGQGLIEYALIILLVVLGVIAVLGLLGIQLVDSYDFILDIITDL